jgi:hypothetical protein
MHPEGKHANPVLKARAVIDVWKNTADRGEEPHRTQRLGL